MSVNVIDESNLNPSMLNTSPNLSKVKPPKSTNPNSNNLVVNLSKLGNFGGKKVA